MPTYNTLSPDSFATYNADNTHYVENIYRNLGSLNSGATPFSVGSPLRRWEEIYAKNPTINTSDPKHKKHVKDCDLGLGFVMSLRPVSFQWRVEAQGARHYGFLGDEVLEALQGRSFAGVVEAQGGIGIRYTELISPLVKAIQEQQAQIESLKVEVRKLRRQ